MSINSADRYIFGGFAHTPLYRCEKVQLLHTAACDFDNDLELTEQVQYNEIDVIALIYYIPREEN